MQGTNGEHDVLVLQVVGPHLEAMFNEEPIIIQQAIKSLVRQVALGTSRNLLFPRLRGRPRGSVKPFCKPTNSSRGEEGG